MKRIYKIAILPALFLVTLIGWQVGEKIIIKQAVHENCSQYSIGDDWVGCTIELALSKNDAKYCQSEGIFSPYPGICMEHFAQKTKVSESCNTIDKPRYRYDCLERFSLI